MNIKKLILFTIILISSLQTYSIPVFDAANFQNGLLMKLEALKQTVQQIEQTKNQLKQIENEITNMQSLGSDLTTGQLNDLQRNLQNLLNIKNKTKSQLTDFQNFNSNFNKLYGDFDSFDSMSAIQIEENTDNLLQESKDTLEDSMRITEIGSMDKLSNDTQRVKTIMNATNSAEGQKQVLQGTSQLAAMQIEILGQQRTLMAQSLKAQNTVLLKETQEEAIEKAELKKLFEIDPSLSGEGHSINIEDLGNFRR